MKKILILTLSALCIFTTGCSKQYGGDYVEVYETTGSKSRLIERLSDIDLVDLNNDSMNITVEIDPSVKGQEYQGVGASLTHSSAYLLMQLSKEERTNVLKEMFDPSIGFNLIRVPLGSSDYVHTDFFFTLNDLEDSTKEDLELTNFNFDNDADIITVAQEILAINPNASFMACPWSAPAWMKTTDSLIGGDLEEQYEEVYANYLFKYVDEMSKKGVPISQVSLINEPFISNIKYPHMGIDGAQAARVAVYLGKTLEKNKFDTSVMIYEHNYSSSIGTGFEAEIFLDNFFENKEATKYVQSVSYHGYENSGFYDFVGGVEYVQENFGKDVFITEITEHSGGTDFAQNISYSLENVVLNPFNSGVSGVMYWNFILTSDGTPVHGNDATCYGLMSLDINEDGTYETSKYAAYYSLAHFSKFLQPIDGKNAVSIYNESSNSDDIIASSFLREDGRIVSVIHNTSDQFTQDVDIIIGKKQTTYSIAPQSVITVVI